MSTSALDLTSVAEPGRAAFFKETCRAQARDLCLATMVCVWGGGGKRLKVGGGSCVHNARLWLPPACPKGSNGEVL